MSRPTVDAARGRAVVPLLLGALLLAGPARAASTMGSPVAVTEHGHFRGALSFAGEGPPGVPPTLSAKLLRFDVVPVDYVGVFVDGSWTNSLEDRVGGLRLRAWTVGGGVRGAVFATRTVGFGLVGRGSYGHDWIAAPYYLMGDSGDIVTPSTATSATTTTGDGTVAPAPSTSPSGPLIPAWAIGERADETRRFIGRGMVCLVLGEKDSGWYTWAGARMTLHASQAVTGTEESRTWDVSLGPGRPAGATVGFEANSDDILGIGDPRRRWLSAGLELHLVDVTGIAVWMGYGW